jgi:hypothetical protein
MKSTKLRGARYAARITGEKCIQIAVRKPEKKRLLGRLSHRCQDNIIVEHKGIGCGGVNWI